MGNTLSSYALKKTDTLTDDVEYFDFINMEFVDECPKLVPLAAIDSLTSIFLKGQDLVNYTEKKIIYDREYPYKFIIERQDKNGNVLATYPAVFDDEIIGALSKSTDGRVDFTNDSNYTTLCQIVNELGNPKNGLSKWILSSKVSGKKVNDHSKEIIEKIAKSDNKPPFGRIMDAFRPYNEFRALYLRYKGYKGCQPVLEGDIKHIIFPH